MLHLMEPLEPLEALPGADVATWNAKDGKKLVKDGKSTSLDVGQGHSL